MSSPILVGHELNITLFKEYERIHTSNIIGVNQSVIINNRGNIGDDPIIIITFTVPSINPVLNVRIDNIVTTYQYTGSVVANDVIIINSRFKYATKNGTYILYSNYPTIPDNSYCEIYMDKNIGNFTVQYMDWDETPIYTEFRENFNYSPIKKKVLLPKRYSNSTYRENKVTSTEVTFDFDKPLHDKDQILKLIDENKTFRIEIDGINEDTNEKLEKVLCRCILDYNLSAPNDEKIIMKISGTGVILNGII